MTVHRHTVPPGLDGRRLDVVVAALTGSSRSSAAASVAAGEVRLGDRVVAKGATVAAGDVIEVVTPDVPEVAAPTMPPVRWQDEHLLVIAKPVGLVVHAGAGHQGDTLVDACRAAGVLLAGGDDPLRPGVVHRLDRDTSGLMVLTTSTAAYEGFVTALRDRAVGRRYLALATGSLTSDRGRIEAPIGRDPRDRTRFAVVHDGRDAVTRYRVLDRGSVPIEGGDVAPTLGLVCELGTGRTHQIRVHLASVGAPVVGDPRYGTRPRVARALGLARPALHAAALAFTHPVTGAPVVVTEPLPADLVAAFGRAGLEVPSPDVRV